MLQFKGLKTKKELRIAQKIAKRAPSKIFMRVSAGALFRGFN